MPWTCGKNTCPSRYTFFGKGCKRILFRGLERATWTGYSNSKNRPLTLFEKEYYDPPPAYRRRPEITRMEAQTASARGYLKLPGRHPFPAAGGQRKGTSLRSKRYKACSDVSMVAEKDTSVYVNLMFYSFILRNIVSAMYTIAEIRWLCYTFNILLPCI